MPQIWASLEDVAETVHRRVCPLYTFDSANRIRLVGSGVPFRTDGLAFILTAAHVFGAKGGAELPLFTIGGDLPFALAGQRYAYEYIPHRTLDPDVGLISTSVQELELLSEYYAISTPADVGHASDTADDSVVMIAGYPETRNRVLMRRSVSVRATPTYVITPCLTELPVHRHMGKHPTYHFGISAEGKRVSNFRGRQVVLPKPVGMSGGGVWRIEIDASTRLAGTPTLIGVAIEFVRAQALFIAARVQLGIPLAHGLASDIRETQRVNAGGA